MKNLSSKILIPIILLLFDFQNGMAQGEYFVTVDPATGIHTKVDSLPGVNFIQVGPSFSTVDKVNDRYFFKGKNSTGQEKLYTVNGSNGKIIRASNFPSSGPSYTVVGNLEFDDSTGVIYALGIAQSTAVVYFLRIDTSSATMSTLSVIPGVPGGADYGGVTYDQKKHRYLFTCYSTISNSVQLLISINALTGSIIASPTVALVGRYSNIRFNSLTGKLYGMIPPNMPSSFFKKLVEIDHSTGLVSSIVTTINPTTTNWTTPNFCSIDETKNLYTFYNDFSCGGNPQFCNLTSVNLSTGAYTYNPSFPVGLTIQGENVIELRYNNNNGKLYGLHWSFQKALVGIVEHAGTVESFNIVPNPSSNWVSLRFNKEYGSVKISISDLAGQIVKVEELAGCSSYEVNTSQLGAGIYFVKVVFEKDFFEIRKMVVE